MQELRCSARGLRLWAYPRLQGSGGLIPEPKPGLLEGHVRVRVRSCMWLRTRPSS